MLSGAALAGLPEPRSGKVREVYDLGSEVLIVSTDRISAFDVIMQTGVPDKGRILNQMSLFWFDRLHDICPNHVIASSEREIRARVPQSAEPLIGRTTIARKATPLPVECVVRGYITGSLYKEYRAGQTAIAGLPQGLLDGSRLADPIFTPSTKAMSGHDENISFNQMVDTVGREVAEQARDWTLELYIRARDHAERQGLILADTKFEFGLTEDGLILIDEALTPDSSRYWEASLWKPGGAQPSFDKQFLRDYLESIGWAKTPPGPELPDHVVSQTRAKYLEAFRRIVGRELDAATL